MDFSFTGSPFALPQQRVLRQRQLCLDPHTRQQTLKKRLYSQSSFVKRFQIEKRLDKHQGCVNCINFSHSGQLLASGSDDLEIILWDWAKGSPVSSFHSKHVANVFQAKFMPQTNDSVIVSAARDGQVRCHVISTTGDLVTTKRVSHHSDSAHKLAIEPDNPHVFLSCGEDSNVLEIDLRDNDSQRKKLISVRDSRNSRVALYSIFIDPSNYNRFAVSGRDEYARVYDRRVLSESKSSSSSSDNPNNGSSSNGSTSTSTSTAHTDPLEMYCPNHLTPDSRQKAHMTCLAYSHDGKELLCSYNDEDIYTFDTTVNGSKDVFTKRFEGHRNSATVKGVNYFGLNSEYIVSGSDCGHVFLWDKETQEIVQYLEGDFEGVVNCLEPHPHIPILAISGLDHDVKIISPSSDKLTDLEGLSEVVKDNAKRRKEDSEYTLDGYDTILSLIMREYRRGLRHRAGIESDDEDDSNPDYEDDSDLLYSEASSEDDDDQEENEEGEDGDGEREGRRDGGSQEDSEGGGGAERERRAGRRRRHRRLHIRRLRRDQNGNDDDEDDEDMNEDAIQCVQS